MLTGLSIRDVVLVEALDLEVGAGLTVLTGETGAGKSIILDSLGLATGARADAGLVRAGAERASVTAVFAPAADHPVWAVLDDKGLERDAGDDLVLRRQLGADGRSRAFVNDQAVGVGVLKELGALLIEVHGQHETVGLLDRGTHRGLLDAFGRHGPLLEATRRTWRAWREAVARLENLRTAAERAASDREELEHRLIELDRLDPNAGEETSLAEERALLGAAEKALADLKDAREQSGGDAWIRRLSSAARAVEHARSRAAQAGLQADNPVFKRLTDAGEALDRTITEATEALACLDLAADAFEIEPGRLDKAEERLFALRAAARKFGVSVEALPAERARVAEALRLAEDGAAALAEAERAASAARREYEAAAEALSAARRASSERLAAAVAAELTPLKLERARFRVAVEPAPEDRRGPEGADRVAFEVCTNPGAAFGPLDAIASGGELARFALALKASLAGEGAGAVMIFDEVDQGVGGAVADAVGLRLKRLAGSGQVLVVTHSPQVAARGDRHWKVAKADTPAGVRTRVEALDATAREAELARMLAGAEVTAEARAAARALMQAA